jgi:peptidoglycan hydrolase-like protein with peptidoglycan-binding domain
VAPLYTKPSQSAPSSCTSEIATERQLVLTAQLLLKALGYSTGKLDGYPSPDTTAAIEQFQEDHVLAQDGLVTGSLLVRLGEQLARASDQ